MSQTNTENFSKQVPIAIAALGQHIHEHQLPCASLDIDIESYRETIEVVVFGQSDADRTAWLNSLIIDDEQNEPGITPGRMRTAWSVRLPVGVAFTLVMYRTDPLPVHLTSVPA